jgi:hypothetical protein
LVGTLNQNDHAEPAAEMRVQLVVVANFEEDFGLSSAEPVRWSCYQAFKKIAFPIGQIGEQQTLLRRQGEARGIAPDCIHFTI